MGGLRHGHDRRRTRATGLRTTLRRITDRLEDLRRKQRERCTRHDTALTSIRGLGTRGSVVQTQYRELRVRGASLRQTLRQHRISTSKLTARIRTTTGGLGRLQRVLLGHRNRLYRSRNQVTSTVQRARQTRRRIRGCQGRTS